MTCWDIERSSCSIARFRREIASDRSRSSWSCSLLRSKVDLEVVGEREMLFREAWVGRELEGLAGIGADKVAGEGVAS